jgi:hypothetical protein
MRTYSQYDYLSTEICFLLELDIGGRTYRFSSFPIYFEESGEQVMYEGRLDNPDVALSLEEVGKVKFSQSAVSMSITLPFNVAERQLQGKGIDRSQARLYYVTVRNGEIQQLYNERIAIFSGVIAEPIYGHPDMPVGYVEFSIENEIELSDQSLLRRVVGENAFISATQFSQESYRTNAVSPPVDPDGITEVIKPHLGKSSPVVIGSPGSITDELGESYGFPSTPAYQIAFQNSGSFPSWYVIAGHPVKAATVDMYDNQGNVDTDIPVHSQVGSKGQVYSFVNLHSSSPLDQSFVVNTDFEYWVRWDDGGGLLSPYDTGQALQGGGDLIVYMLDSSGITYDRQALSSVRALLNEYKFAGYINDPEIKCYDFLQRYIVSFLPVALVAGPEGLYPIIDHRLDDSMYNPRVEITADQTFTRIQPISPRSSEIINDLTVRFSPQGTASNSEDAYRGVAVIRANRLEGVNAQYEIVSPYCIVSQQRYGRREQTISLDFVYDRETAIKIGQDYIRRKALPEKITTYRASFEYGYLDIGDIISLTDTEISLSQYRVMIIGKRYDGASWLYDILIQENPILEER